MSEHMRYPGDQYETKEEFERAEAMAEVVIPLKDEIHRLRDEVDRLSVEVVRLNEALKAVADGHVQVAQFDDATIGLYYGARRVRTLSEWTHKDLLHVIEAAMHDGRPPQ